jgi:hypothetical protein
MILEQSLLQLADQRSACAFADTSVVHTRSKAEALSTFRRLAGAEAARAAAEERLLQGRQVQGWVAGLGQALGLAQPEPQLLAAGAGALASVTLSMDEEEEEERAPMGGQSIFGSLVGALLPGQPRRGSDGSEAVVVTLVVAARGRLEVPEAPGSWQQLRHAMQVRRRSPAAAPPPPPARAACRQPPGPCPPLGAV